ncbi:MAG: T9SS type A sorting domain-containing protein [Bacteroidia bacterium]
MKKIFCFILSIPFFNCYCQIYSAGTTYSTYYNIVPDTLLNYVDYPYTHETYGLDLFDNSQVDFLITADGSVSPGGTSEAVTIISQNPNVSFRFGRLDSVFVPAYSYWDVTKVALPLSAGDQINSTSAVWDTSLLYLTDHTGWGGGNKNVNDWIGTDKFIGLKYQSPGITTYGWIRVQCKSKDSCFVKDYSFDSNLFGIQGYKENSAGVFPNPSSGFFYIIDPENTFSATTKIKVMNAFGEESKFTYEQKQGLIQINMSDNPKGHYFIKYTLNGHDRVEKLIKGGE